MALYCMRYLYLIYQTKFTFITPLNNSRDDSSQPAAAPFDSTVEQTRIARDKLIAANPELAKRLSRMPHSYMSDA